MKPHRSILWFATAGFVSALLWWLVIKIGSGLAAALAPVMARLGSQP